MRGAAGSLSDLLKGLTPSSRNANQPTRPNLTSLGHPSNSNQGTPKIDSYARGSSYCAVCHLLFIYSLNPSPPPPFWGNQTPPITAQGPAQHQDCVALDCESSRTLPLRPCKMWLPQGRCGTVTFSGSFLGQLLKTPDLL